MEKNNVILNKLLAHNNAQEWMENLNDIIYEYSYMLMEYSSQKGYVLTDEHTDLLSLNLLMNSFKSVDNSDEVLLGYNPKNQWIKRFVGIIVRYSVATFESDGYAPEYIGFHLRLLEDIIVAFEV